MIVITAEKEELQQELTDLSHHYDNLKTDNEHVERQTRTRARKDLPR